ncbi:hypothetical protein V3C99_015606 [Haemonchus contortus]
MASGAERVKARIVRRIIAKRGREAADGDEDESEGACSKRDEATTTKVHYAFGQYAAKQMAPKQSMLLVNSVVCVDRIGGEEECSLFVTFLHVSHSPLGNQTWMPSRCHAH